MKIILIIITVVIICSCARKEDYEEADKNRDIKHKENILMIEVCKTNGYGVSKDLTGNIECVK